MIIQKQMINLDDYSETDDLCYLDDYSETDDVFHNTLSLKCLMTQP